MELRKFPRRRPLRSRSRPFRAIRRAASRPAGRQPAALARARALLEGGPGAEQDLSRIGGAGATPEEKLRRAEVLVMLHDNVGSLTGALTDAVREAPGFKQLAKDADDALDVFS